MSLRDNLLLGAFGDIDDDVLADAMAPPVPTRWSTSWAASTGRSVIVASPSRAGSGSGSRSLARSSARPRVLVLDDALSAVNPSLEAEIMRRVRRLRCPTPAILYVTRRQGLSALADRTIELPAPADAPNEDADDSADARRRTGAPSPATPR